jgi:hypothetical protein
LNNQTKIDLSKPFITFNLGDMPRQVKPVMMFLILDYVYTKMKHDKERKLLVVDEAWSLLARTEEEGYIFEIVKTCRKFNMGLLLITQDVADLLNSKAGRAVLANSSYTILLRQKPVVISSAEAIFHLSYAEREHLLTANVGEGLLMMENDHQEIKIIASPEEHKLITTRPDDLILMEQGKTADLPVDAKKLIKQLYPLKDVYKISSLDFVQKEYLEKHQNPEYEEKSVQHPFAQSPGLYLVRKKGNEGHEHVSLIWWIYEELLNYTSSVRLAPARSHTLNPDIIFTNASGKEIALEIETGSNHKFNKEYLHQKVALLDKTYPSRWCFFLTTNSYLQRYQNITAAPIYLRKHVRGFLKQQFPSGMHPPHITTPPSHTKTSDDKTKSYGREVKSMADRKTQPYGAVQK